ncbi:hypothetical protein H4R18_004144 [Coemansia javaensis]|uniref:Uncharacterized protein n=1 Tax=Coemansia javaensis TaxID=2761396 RepID=A0A9W8H6J1_9FUNG|nr:hypothetical protein H4R18_004144 [Coemansia javaensis]
MPAHAPHAPARLRCAPVAELCGVVASNGRRAALPRRPSCRALPARASQKAPPAADAPSRRHGRSLEILRAVLAAAAALQSRPAAEKPAAEKPAPAPGSGAALLAERRAALVGALRGLQHPHAETVGAIHALLENRVWLGLLSAAAACAYAAPLDLPLAIAAPAIPSSLESRDTAATLVADDDDDDDDDGYGDSDPFGPLAGGLARFDADDDGDSDGSGLWSHSRRWRGPSISSECTLVGVSDALHVPGAIPDDDDDDDAAAAAAPAAIPDDMGVCWPLGGSPTDSARSWGRFYAELGQLRVPTRYRVPHRSLAMLATEQLMMRNDKIVCPLKNRLQESNPRRQAFEDYIRATGSIPPPPPPAAAARPRSPLQHTTRIQDT